MPWGQHRLFQFRRTPGISTAQELAIGGTLTKAQANSILLSTDTGEYLIPMPVILSVKFELPTPTKAAVTGTLIPKAAP